MNVNWQNITASQIGNLQKRAQLRGDGDIVRACIQALEYDRHCWTVDQRGAMARGICAAAINAERLPEIVAVSYGNYREFEIRGGEVSEEWAKGLHIPAAPWCRLTIWNRQRWDAAEGRHVYTTVLGDNVSSYGGEVWPSAWPELFEPTPATAQTGGGGVKPTPLGRELLIQALIAVQA